MFEFEDMSTGFHDVFLSKYTDSSGPILDLYISDSMQDMLDIDIRSEVATVVGGTNEFSSLINDLPSLELDSNSNDGEASWLGGPKWSATNHADFYADVGACVNPNSVMPIITSSLLTSPKSQINLNTNNYRQNLSSPPPSPKENKSHLTFSPNQIKVPSTSLHEIRKTSQLALPNNTEQLEAVKKDLRNIVTSLSNNNNNNNNGNERKTMINNQQNNINNINNNNNINNKILNGRTLISSSSTNNHQLINGSNTIKLAPGIGGLTFANNFAYTKLKQQNLKQISSSSQQLSSSSPSSNLNGNNIIIKRERDSSPLQNNNIVNNNNYTSNGNILSQQHNSSSSNNNNKILSRNILIQNKNITTMNGNNSSPVGSPNSNTKNNNNNNNKPKPTGQEFPKPAYSYSCLIAMALKNSRSGSLPVSEIYSFMCEHFPYFKTAPNGWKNSVRHNLSLNKCFEKIEKPATNGGQRKGCLWAMNPTKITKMDEEVQKWSRKDPMAIRKAMVYPEHLEALERGEMKHGSTGDSDNENEGQSDVEEVSDLGEDNEMDETLVETQESMEEEDDEQQDRDFEIEVQDIYDAIDLEDDKESLRMNIRQNDLIEFNENNFSSPKRARLDVNYTINSNGSYKQQQHAQIKQEISSPHHQQLQQIHQQHQTPHHNRRKMQLVNRIA